MYSEIASMPIEQRRVAEDFNRAAQSYDEHARLQHTLMSDACLLAGYYFKPNDALLDVGCGTGGFASYALDYDKQWNITGIDIAPAMVEKAKRYAPSILANAESIPFEDASFDGVFSGVCMQWITDKEKAFSEMARVTKKDGCAIITSFGARTLQELRAAMCNVGMEYGVMEMPTVDIYTRLAKKAGWRVKSAQQSTSLEYAPSVEAVMFQLRRIGATNKHKDRPRHLFGLRRFEKMIAEYEKVATPLGIPVTWDVISLVLEK
jgi:malonyl-CoA O-methyltransferase